jgi:hypothetical protein
MEKLSFHLDPVPPFRLDLTAWLLRRRADNIIDRWDGKCYHRVLILENEPGDDVEGRNYLQRWLGMKDKLDYGRVQQTLAAWKPYAGLIYLYELPNLRA